jgi:uncharacterized membrane protein
MTSIISSCRCPATVRLPAALAVLFAGLGFAAPAHADFRLCNSSASRVGVSVGYKDGENWVTEGWWNIAASSCETLLKGPLVARYYYVYALDYDRGGEWGGIAYMCTRGKEFTIRGVDNCMARGYDRTGFFEIDTGEQRSWTVQLTETTNPNASAAARAPATARAAPLNGQGGQ